MSEASTNGGAPASGRIDRTQPPVIRAEGIWKVFGPHGDRLVGSPDAYLPPTDGSSEGMLLFNFPGLDALVNVGSSQEVLTLPAVARVLGADDLAPTIQGEVSTSYTGLCGAIEQTGASRLVALIQ